MAKKGLLGLLVGEPKPGADEHSDPEDDEGSDGDEDTKARAERAFRRLREAIDDGDDKAGARALHDAIEACQAAEYGDEEDAGDEEGGGGD